MIRTINNCRLCGSSDIPTVWDFGNSPLANRFKTREDLKRSEPEFPLRYFKCSKCHSVQLKDEIDPATLFKDYLYESPPNLIPHFNELAETTHATLGLQKNSLVIDIGSNNGLLLREYEKLGCKIYGIEPAKNVADKARNSGIPTFNNFFDKDFAISLNSEMICPKLITCTNCFAHLSDLNNFVEGLDILMGDESYFVFENAYLADTIKNLDFGQAYFEHFYMHSVTPLCRLFKKHGLELFKVEYNNVQMGSIRGYVRRVTNKSIPIDVSVEIAIDSERVHLSGLEVYRQFIDKIYSAKNRLQILLDEAKNTGYSISIYGWPAKMTLLNQIFKIDKYIDYVIEESPVKIGKYCPGTSLEIKSLEYFKNNPTSICLLGAYNFESDIKKKNAWYNGQWVNPLNI